MRKKIEKNFSIPKLAVFSAVLTLIFFLAPQVWALVDVDDLSISSAVENELMYDPAVMSHRIDITTSEGIVTLKGSVDNILAKERAARIAQTVKGVRAVINNITVDPPFVRTDEQIRDDVQDALLTDPATDLYEIDVKVKDNRVTLGGAVESRKERELCAKVAKGVKGVTDVMNNISVDWDVERSDPEIRSEVEQALKWDAYVDHALIDVTVEDAEVALDGVVGSAAEKRWAIWDAYVNGVDSVDSSDLEVQRWTRDEDLRKNKYPAKSDTEIRQAVMDAFLYDPRVSSFDVLPMVDKGIVTLRGEVDNLKAKRAAARDARNVVGVAGVENRIKVRPLEENDDKVIQQQIEKGLVRNPFTESFEITVDVNNGVVDLFGTVDTYFEKSEAEDLASRVNGVLMVDNNILVTDKTDYYTYDPYVDDRYVYDYDWYEPTPGYPTKSDLRIREDIKDEFFWSPFVDGDDIVVEVDDGEATLTGTVDSWSEYYSASENAYEGGAVFVDNDLVVMSR